MKKHPQKSHRPLLLSTAALALSIALATHFPAHAQTSQPQIQPQDATQPAAVPAPPAMDLAPEPPPAPMPRSIPITAKTLTDDHVVEALKKGADFLLSRIKTDNWESGQHWTLNGQHGGETALVVYALLHAGESLRDDPVYGPKLNYHSKELAPAIAWLCKINPEETYTAALLANALSLLPQKPDDPGGPAPRAALERAYRFLFSAMGNQGGYTYGTMSAEFNGGSTGRRGFYYLGDLSNAQYGALGMWALAQTGFDAPLPYWQTTDRYWRRLQSATGSWPYRERDSNAADRNSMGVAGIATLFIAQEFTDKTLRSTPLVDKTLDLGLQWLGQTFNPDSGDLYYMYGVERVGLASGLKYFGTQDWYRLCAADIINHQQVNGSWTGNTWFNRGFNGATETTSTSYALLFLARGRNPIPFNKLQYDGPWNARPRDDAFLTRWLSKRFERPLNWQVVNLNVKATEWLDAPILLITGSADPGFTSSDIDKLRTFINGGGMIFSSADDGSPVFTNAIRKYAGQVVSGRYEMHQMPKNHPLFSPELGADLPNPPPLQSMSNGVREIWVHSPGDMGASWQLQRFTNKANFETPTALYFYATGRMPIAGKLKPMEPADPVPGSVPPIPPGRSLRLARVSYGGNFDPEPGAWPRLAKILRLPDSTPNPTDPDAPPASPDRRIDLTVTTVAIKDLDPAKYPVAHMTGTARFLQKPEEADALRRYLNNGGTLIADAAGGNDAFAGEFLHLAQILYPNASPAPLPPDHPIFTGNFPALPGDNTTEITFRKFGANSLGRKITQPDLQAITVDGRIRILFSKYDITSGLLGTNTWAIVGYSPDSSRKLAANILRWILTAKPPEAPAPQ